MTVENTTQKITGNGNGVATVFSFSPMVIFDTTDIVVTQTTAAGVETILSEGTTATTYSVQAASGSYPSATGVTGQITFPASGGSPIATGVTLTIKRVLALTQTVDLENQGGYFPETQETALDRGVMLSAQLDEALDRTIRQPVADTVLMGELPNTANRASKTLTFDSAGDPTASTITTGSPVSTAMEPIVGAATVAAGRDLLSVITTRGDITRGGASGVDERLALGTTGHVLQSDGTDVVSGQVVAAGIATDAVETAKIQDNAVTLAKQAHGTQGGVQFYGVSGAPSELAAGTSGQFLQTQGASSNPQFANSLGWQLIESQTLSNQANADFTTGIDGTFKHYMVLFDQVVPATDDTEFSLRISDDGGSTFEAGASDYRYVASAQQDVVATLDYGSTGDTQIRIGSTAAGGGIGSAANEDGIHGVLWVSGLDLARKHTFTWTTGYKQGNGSVGINCGAATDEGNLVVDALRFRFISGNLESGTIKLFGMRES